VASIRTEGAPAPLDGARLARVPGVLGAIARERAADLAGSVAELPTRAGDSARRGRLRAALAGPGLALLAEVKRASPSQGAIADLDPVAAGWAYAAGGAAALSVLTEPRHFGGERAHLRAVAAAVDLPLLRKDFVVHPRQLLEARDDGAAAALLIAAVLGDALGAYLRATWSLGLDALVEVHDEAELDLALAAGADLIGVNNRDLRTLAIDTGTAPRLIERGRAVGHDAVWVAESGYASGAEVRALAGVADAVLVGTSLAGSGDLEGATRAFLAAAAAADGPSGRAAADDARGEANR
jgi:indole-3-glycerol phosphate synthase